MKKSVELSLEEAEKAYKSHDAGKAILEKIFPSLKGSVFDRVKSFEAVLEEVGQTLESWNHRTQFDDPHEKANKRIDLITQALNEGEKTPRWYIWFNEISKGADVGLSLRLVDYNHDLIVVCCRHRFVNEKAANHAIKYFLSDFEEAYL